MHVYFPAISVGHLACHVPTFPNVFAMIGGPNVEWGLPGGETTRVYYVAYPPANVFDNTALDG